MVRLPATSSQARRLALLSPCVVAAAFPPAPPQSRLLKSLEPISEYKDRNFKGSLDAYVARLRETRTVYVGNLAFHTSEEQIHELFSSCGPLMRIIMGLDRNALTPCGFCFVEYYTRAGAEDCVKYLCGTTLDERVVRIDFDWCVRLHRLHRRTAGGASDPAHCVLKIQGLRGRPAVWERQERRPGAGGDSARVRRRPGRLREERRPGGCGDGVRRQRRGSCGGAEKGA